MYHRSLIIKECGKNAKQIEFVFVDTPLAACLERNRSRARHVPDDVIRRYIARLIPPTEAEGGKVVYVGGDTHA